MDKVFWAIVVPSCLVGLVLVHGLCHRLIPKTRPVEENRFLPYTQPACQPKPREQTRYVASIVVVACILAGGAYGARHLAPPKCLKALDRKWVRVPVIGVQLLLIGFVVAMVVFQERHVYPYLDYVNFGITVIGAGLSCLAWVAAPAAWKQRAAAGLARAMERVRPRLRSGAACLVALLGTLGGLAPALHRDGQPDLPIHFAYHVPFHLGEFAAVQNGGTPLVDFFPQYQSCISYLTLPAFALVGLNLETFTGAMVVLGALSLLAVYYAFVRLTGGTWRALVLYVPLLGAGLYPLYANGYESDVALHQLLTPFTYFAVGPLRYFGPCMTLACLVPVLRRPSRFGLVLLFGVGSLTAINNLDFGVPALAAALCAVTVALSGTALPSLRLLGRVLGCFLVGAALALVAFGAVTYLRTATLPSPGAVTTFQSMWMNGFNAIPMPVAGFHLIVLLTFLAAVAKGLYAIRLTPLARGLLLYAGIFGSGALMYYVVRSHPHVLITLFLAWAFALLLLVWICWEETAADVRAGGWRRALRPLPVLLTLGYLAVLTSVAGLPNLRREWQRLALPPSVGPSECDRLTQEIAALTASGDSVTVLHLDGHLACLRAGVRNHFPFTNQGSLILYSQEEMIMRVLDEKQVRYVIHSFNEPAFLTLLAGHGYRPVRRADHWTVYGRTDLADSPTASPPAPTADGVE